VFLLLFYFVLSAKAYLTRNTSFSSIMKVYFSQNIAIITKVNP